MPRLFIQPYLLYLGIIMKRVLSVLSIAFCLNTNAQIITTVVGNGTMGYSGDGGYATSAEIGIPAGVAFDALGNMYVADTYNYRVRKVNPTGIITTIAGNGTTGYSGDGGQATFAELSGPSEIAIDASNNLYIADGNSRIRKVNTSG